MWNKVIVFIHVLGMIFMATYAFVFQKSTFDYLYLSSFYFILLHWTFLNGECVVAFASKYVNNPDYVPGEDVHKDDLITLYPEYETSIRIMNVLKQTILFLNYYLVCVRNEIPFLLYSTFITIYILYLIALIFYDYPCQNDSFLLIQDIVKYTLLAGIAVFFLYLMRRKEEKPGNP